VNKLTTKMIWTAHSRTVRFMANDDKATTPFWDFQQFDDQCFADFFPGNAFSVVGMMDQSWHRAFSPPSMVRYSAKQYQTGPDASPFEEIDDVTGHTTLFEDRSAAHAASHDRVVRPPRTKKPKNQNLPGATLRDDTTIPRSDWLQGLADHGADGSLEITENHRVPATLHDTSKDALRLEALPENDTGVYGAQSVWRGTVGAVDESNPAHGRSVHMGNEAGLTLVCPTLSQAEPHTRLESLVALHGPDVLLKESGPSSLSEATPIEGTGRKALWRMALIEHHKQQLAERWPKSQQPREAPLDFDSYVDRAIKRGDLKRLVPGLRRIVDFVDSPAVAPSSIEPRVESQNRHQLEDLRVVEHIPHTEPVMQLNSQAGTTANSSVRLKRPRNQVSVNRSTKRRKSAPLAKKSKTSTTAEPTSRPNSSAGFSSNCVPEQTHSGDKSRTLENHQQLPPDAYFERTADDEQPAWRCGIKHPMGYYYNAGDRKNCPGCFTNFRDNPKRKVMDFYLPSYSYFFQPAPPGSTWKPQRPLGKPRRSKNLSHNSIAKDAYWDAINAGTTTDEARRKGIEAVEAYLRAKEEKKEKKEPTPEPTPEPVDLGPHPSGSRTMEHGQELPVGAYWKKRFRYDELAWRCDVNHALGRYYLGGDVRSCPGCGSCRSGPGKYPQMDFYLPAGSIARHEAPGLVKWKPRRPNKLTKKSKKAKQIASHNQFCARKYWELIDEGREHVEGGANEEALALAIEATDAYIDAKVAAIQAKLDGSGSTEEEPPKTKNKSNRKGNSKQRELHSESSSPVRCGRSGARLFSPASSPPVVRGKRGSEELNDSELDEVTEYESTDDEDAQPETISVSSTDESTSESDSE
jgi:hypothetical protein